MSPLTVSLRAAPLAALLVVAGCGSVASAPEPVIPKPIVRQLPVKAAVLLTGDQRVFRHAETRSGVDWLVALGKGHQRCARSVRRAICRCARLRQRRSYAPRPISR